MTKYKVLLMLFAALVTTLVGAKSSALQYPEEFTDLTCQTNPEVVDEMADRLLVHYHCSSMVVGWQIAQVFKFSGVQFQQRDAQGKPIPFWDDNGLPIKCNEYIQKLHDLYSADPAMRVMAEEVDFRNELAPLLRGHSAILREHFESRRRAYQMNTIGNFLADLFGLPRDANQAIERSRTIAGRIYNAMSSRPIQTPALFRAVSGAKAKLDLFVSLWSLNSDLTNGCGEISITNWELKDGRCRRINEYTPMFLDFLTDTRSNIRLAARSPVNCHTLLKIHNNYLGPQGFDLGY